MAEARGKGPREVLRLGLPGALMSLGIASMGTIDVAMVAPLGKSSLAAMALANSYASTVVVLVSNVLAPGAVLVSRGRAAGDRDAVSSTLRNSLALAVLISLPTMLLLGFPEPAMRALAGPDQQASTIAEAVLFSRAFVAGIPAVMLFMATANFVEGHRYMWTPVVILAGANVLNVVGDLGLIYGRWGLPALGSAGSAWATTIVRWGMGLAMAAFIVVRPDLRAAAELRRWREVSWVEMRKMAMIGIPLGLRTGVRFLFYMMLTAIVSRFSTTDLAANQIAFSLFVLALVLHTGFNSAASIVHADNVQRKDFVAARGALRMAALASVAFAGVVMVIAFAFGRSIVGLYTQDPTVAESAHSFLITAAIAHVGAAVALAMVGGTLATLDTKYLARISILLQILIGLPLAWLLAMPLGLGPATVWFGPLASESLLAVFLYRRFLERTKGTPA